MIDYFMAMSDATASRWSLSIAILAFAVSVVAAIGTIWQARVARRMEKRAIEENEPVFEFSRVQRFAEWNDWYVFTLSIENRHSVCAIIEEVRFLDKQMKILKWADAYTDDSYSKILPNPPPCTHNIEATWIMSPSEAHNSKIRLRLLFAQSSNHLLLTRIFKRRLSSTKCKLLVAIVRRETVEIKKNIAIVIPIPES